MSSVVLGATIIEQITRQGVTDIVVCPGSRSGPLSVAAATSHQRVHVRIDERSAGYLAVGIARAQTRPVAIITTSGTAVGNLLPAVMEAHHSHIPLLVLSADRPASLVGTGANQTTYQHGIFTGFTRDTIRLASTDNPSSWAPLAARGTIAAIGTLSGNPGPVHFNIELAEPLTGHGSPSPCTPLTAQRRGTPAPLDLEPGPATVVIAGDADLATGAEAAAFAQVAHLPLIAEPSSNARVGSNALASGRLLLDTPLGADIERVIVFGHPTLSRPVTRLLGRNNVDVVAVSPHPTWPDPTWTVHQVTSGVRLDNDDPEWLHRWRAADTAVSAMVARDYTTPASGSAAVNAVHNALTSDDVLFVGPSQVVRELDLAPIATEPPIVYANRGLAGIDGVISSAVGVALGTGTPTTLLCGDLTFLHDTNGLILSGSQEPDLSVVVIDDDGGAIFSTLEAADSSPQVFQQVYRTPHGLDIASVVQGFGVPVATTDVSGIDAWLRQRTPGIRVLVVKVDNSSLPQRTRNLPGAASHIVVSLPTPD